MGQGNYTAIVFGQKISDDFWEFCENFPQFDKWVSQHNIRTAYETDMYVGIWLAVNDNWLADMKKVFAFEGVHTFNELEKLYSQRLDEVKTTWMEFQQQAKQVGLELGDGELLIVNDYD